MQSIEVICVVISHCNVLTRGYHWRRGCFQAPNGVISPYALGPPNVKASQLAADVRDGELS